MAELQPCPFCGSAAKVVHFYDYDNAAPYDRIGVKCEACPGVIGFEGPARDPDAVFSRWNARHRPSPAPSCHGTPAPMRNDA
jgi:hypothetical protein